MRFFHLHATGFWIGFTFGTLGLFALALLRLLIPFIELLTVPFFWPSMFFAELLADDSASLFMVIVLYALTGAFYGFIGSGIQNWRRRKNIRIRRLA